MQEGRSCDLGAQDIVWLCQGGVADHAFPRLRGGDLVLGFLQLIREIHHGVEPTRELGVGAELEHVQAGRIVHLDASGAESGLGLCEGGIHLGGVRHVAAQWQKSPRESTRATVCRARTRRRGRRLLLRG
jgi:hypothetical protein